MQRKVSQIGPATLMVSLPSKWVKKYGIKKGDDINLNEEGAKLILGIEKKQDYKKTSLQIDDLGSFNQNYIGYLYKMGYDEIDVKFKNAEIFKQIQDRVSQLIGFEIIDQKENYCKIKSVSSALEDEFDNLLRRIFLLLIDFSENCLDAIKKEEYDRLKEIKLLEKKNDEFTDLCIRILAKKEIKGDKSMFYYCIFRELEKLGDYYRDVCDFLLKNNKTKLNKDTIGLLKDVNLYLKNFYELFYKFDHQKATILNDQKEPLIKKGEELILKKTDSLIVHSLINLVRQIYELRGPYFQTIL